MRISSFNKEILNRKTVSKYYIPSLLLISLVVACGDFVNKPDQPAASPAPEQKQPDTQPTPDKKDPESKPAQDPATKEKEMSAMCETERTWAYSSNLIDAGELRLYRSKNMAPVYQSPGNRQSGIEGWYPCQKALRANGFYPVNGYRSYEKLKQMENR